MLPFPGISSHRAFGSSPAMTKTLVQVSTPARCKDPRRELDTWNWVFALHKCTMAEIFYLL